MTTYEGMFIFPDRIREDDVDAVVKNVRAEVEKLGGTIMSSTRLGRRNFARPLKKTDQGHYAVMNFELEGDQLKALHARFKLNEDVLRVQFVKALVDTTVAG